MRSPVNFAFRPHQGPVYGCNCSPFHRNLFLTSSTDSSVRLYSLLDVRSTPSLLLHNIPDKSAWQPDGNLPLILSSSKEYHMYNSFI